MAARQHRRGVTLEQVAAEAGVSRSTVSRVVNDAESVLPATRAAVRDVIARLGYVPNRAARSLASNHTMAIALVVPEDTAMFFGDPFFAAIVGGIHSRLGSTGYVLNLMLVGTDPDDKAGAYLRAGNVDGALVASHHAGDALLVQLGDQLPVVFGGRPTALRDTGHVVDVDNVGAARRAVEHLVAAGRRRIATITGPDTMAAGSDRLAGYRAALAAAGLAEGPVVDGGFTAAGGGAAMRRILARDPDVDAVFAASDLMARAALEVLADTGHAVPGRVAVMGFDDSPIATSARPHLTTMRQPSHLLGATMVDVLLQRLAGGEPPREVILPTELVVRDTA